jgi:DNA (cytosine-5)-methyltransferase 1
MSVIAVLGWNNATKLVETDGMAKTFTTLFGGVGGIDLGLIAAGLEPCESIEYDPQLAELHKANIGGKMHVMNILDCDPYRFEKPDILHASPVCCSYSPANTSRGEKQLDVDCARKVCEFLRVLKPQYFTLENVEAYRYTYRDGKITAFGYIVETLNSLGYWSSYQVLNAADFSVPQSRRRLILIAIKDGFIPSLPPKEKHVGWYEAIADLIPTCDRREFADWQKEMTRDITKPFVMSSTEQRADTVRFAHRPIFTIKASDRDPRALIESGETIQLNLKCLATLQTFPKDYSWGDKVEPIRKGIGNSVPPLMIEKIARSVLL